MAAAVRGIWAIDIGNNSLKALHLRTGAAGKLEVVGFDNIEHGKILNGSGISDKEKSELIAASLHRFVEQNDTTKDEVVISVPGQASFARFIKLPPVEPKKIPEIVKFEAVQQIPFDINEVEWDWQEMRKPDSPEIEVGIFAIKNEVINGILEYYVRENLKVTGVQMAPMALFNFAGFERGEVPETDKNAVIVLDMGAENTDLVVCTRTNVWQRSIPIGGNAFTRAVADAFKLEFDKAEKLKRTAPMSKYAKQIFHSMKPVFTDLAAEVQRSIGFYSSANRDVKFVKVLALGGGMKMQGLTKFLQQTTQLPIERPESFDRLELGASVSAAKFHENVGDFGIVYGLAVQGLGLAKIESNLLPRRIARTIAWTRKSNMFTAAAAILMVIAILSLARAMIDKSTYTAQNPVRNSTNQIINEAQNAIQQLETEKSRASTYDAAINKQLEIFKHREVIPQLTELVLKCLPNAENNPTQAMLYKAFEKGDADTIKKLARPERKQLFVTRMTLRYSDNIASDSFASDGSTRAADYTSNSGGGMGMGMPGMGMPGMGMPGMGMPGMGMPGMGMPGMGGGGGMPGMPSSPSPSAGGGSGEPGFIVVIEGYSPYKNIMELLDPTGAAANKARWGTVSRMLNLDAVCPNCPFKLFNKTKREDFNLETGEVDLAKTMPVGVGVEQLRTFEYKSTPGSRTPTNRSTSQKVLIDPLTREVINKVAEVDSRNIEKRDSFGKPIYQVNDHWFRISAKFKWIKDPNSQQTEGMPAGM